KIALLLCINFCTSFHVIAQQTTKKQIDSVVTAHSNGTFQKKQEAYHQLGQRILRNEDPTQASELFRYFLSKDSSATAKIIIYEDYASNLSRLGNLDESIKLKKEGLQLAKQLQDTVRIVFYNITLAFSFDQNNQPDLALTHLNAIEDIIEEDIVQHLHPSFYHAKAVIYGSLKDYEKQEEYLLDMYALIKDDANTSSKRFYLYLILDFYSQYTNPQQLAKFTEILGSHYEDANLDIPKGHMPISALFKKRLSAENIPILTEAISISDSLNSLNSLTATTIALANIYTAEGNPQSGLPYLERAIAKLQQVNKPSDLVDLYTVAATTSAAANNYQDAYRHKLAQTALQDSVTSEKMKRNIAEIEIEYETEKKERKILEQQLELQEQSRQKAQIRNGLVAIAIFALLLFLFFRYRLKSQKTIAEQTASIQTQKITELQQKNKLLAMKSMIEGQEAERLRIAKDLHDSLGGLLSTVKAHFSTLQNEMAGLETLDLTSKTNHLIDEACIEVRRISHNMMPHALSLSGLQGAIEDIGEQLREQQVDVTIEISNLPPKLDATKEVMLYRLVQEIVSNIRKHAAATTVLIQVMGHENEITLLVEDNGRGFNYEAAQHQGGLGLQSINSRVAYLDGSIDWDTTVGAGTSLTINIPIA
ncbi:MAG: sensor histidine kinase, partial [Marinirhabdus sp.]|nr:sensor histidine kinase [Marinirhabdus sp.]